MRSRPTCSASLSSLLAFVVAAGVGCTAPQASIQVTEATAEQCPHGGTVVTVDGEIFPLCNGAPGEDGEDGEDGATGPEGGDGTDGADGADGHGLAVRTSDEPAGEGCPDGGTKIEYGLDLDGDGVLDDAEVTGTSTVCDGTDGADGADGSDGDAPMVSIRAASATECLYGGFVVTVDGVETTLCTPHCSDLDGDGRSAADPVYCLDGDDGCDGDGDNWTATGCASCADGDGDGFGVACDRGPDCRDQDASVAEDCPAPACEDTAIIPGDSLTRMIDAVDDHLFFMRGLGYGVLEIYDLADPGAPSEVASLALTSTTGCYYSGSVKVAPGGDHVYLFGAGCFGLPVIDVADRAHPAPLTRVSGPSAGSMDIDLCGNVLYMATQGKGVAAFDVADPAAPSYLGEWVLGGNPYPYGVTCVRRDDTSDVVYLGDAGWSSAAGLHVFEFDKTTHAFTLASSYTPDTSSWGGRAAALAPDLLFMMWSDAGELAIFDVSDPNSLAAPATVGSAGNINTDVLLRAERLFTTVGGSSLGIFDVSVPTAPSLLLEKPVGAPVVGLVEVPIAGERVLGYTRTGRSDVSLCRLTGTGL